MTEPAEKLPDFVLQLHQEAMRENADNRKELDKVKNSFEEFFREEIQFQADIKHKLDIVSESQKHLKERFEEGTAKTLARIERSFGDFMVEWGAKKKEDEIRDKAINAIDKKAEKANSKYDLLIKGTVVVVFALVLLSYIKGNFQLP